MSTTVIRRVSLVLQCILICYNRVHTQEEAAMMRRIFFLKSALPGVMGCIDDTCVHVQDKYFYVNRKGFHSINIQLPCNSDMQIIDSVA